MTQEPTDIFFWANKIDGIKHELDVELFLFNKNYTPYSVRHSAYLSNYVNPMFLYGLIDAVSLGAGTGLMIRDIVEAEKESNILPRADIGTVGRAETLIHLIENERDDIVEFSSNEHEFKRVLGIVARYTHPTDKDATFYVVKQIPGTAVVSGATVWDFSHGEFGMPIVDASVKMPADNQVLIVKGDIFAFNQAKFEKLFQYNAEQYALFEEKGAAIDNHFKLSFPDLIHEISFAIGGSKKNQKKLLDVDVDNLISQEQVIETADEMQIELMTDDAGAIILMDGNDVGIFLDIINDNYVRGMTGNSYLAKKKQALEVAGE